MIFDFWFLTAYTPALSSLYQKNDTGHVIVTYSFVTHLARALVQWLKWFEPHSGLEVSKKQNVSSLLTRKKSILWGVYTDGGRVDEGRQERWKNGRRTL